MSVTGETQQDLGREEQQKLMIAVTAEANRLANAGVPFDKAMDMAFEKFGIKGIDNMCKKNKPSKKMEEHSKISIAEKNACVTDIIKVIDENRAYEFVEPKMDKCGITQFGHYVYNEKIYEIMRFVDVDIKYQKNFKKIEHKDISKLSMRELSTFFTCLFRSERYIEGLIAEMIDNGTFKNLLLRYLELNCVEK